MSKHFGENKNSATGEICTEENVTEGQVRDLMNRSETIDLLAEGIYFSEHVCNPSFFPLYNVIMKVEIEHFVSMDRVLKKVDRLDIIFVYTFLFSISFLRSGNNFFDLHKKVKKSY